MSCGMPYRSEGLLFTAGSTDRHDTLRELLWSCPACVPVSL